MNPMIATTLTRANQNSASPKPLTPRRFMPMIKTKKIVTQRAEDMGEFQYCIVIAAATISRGSVTIHCKAYWAHVSIDPPTAIE